MLKLVKHRKCSVKQTSHLICVVHENAILNICFEIEFELCHKFCTLQHQHFLLSFRIWIKSRICWHTFHLDIFGDYLQTTLPHLHRVILLTVSHSLVPAGLPDEKGRLQILSIHTAKMREFNLLASDVDLKELSIETKNYSGAELEGLVRAAQSTAMNRHIKVNNTAQRNTTQ